MIIKDNKEAVAAGRLNISEKSSRHRAANNDVAIKTTCYPRAIFSFTAMFHYSSIRKMRKFNQVHSNLHCAEKDGVN